MKKNVEKHPIVADLVYNELRHRIFSRKYAPGERLPEEALARELNVSRTPVREALRRLFSDGLVQMVPNVGARLINPSDTEIAHAYELLAPLECLAARKAAEQITDDQGAALSALLDEELRIFQAQDFSAYIDVNNRFHCGIAEASGNPVLAEFVANLRARTNVYMFFYEKFFDLETNPAIDEHRALLKAILSHDASRAEQLMKVHLMLSGGALKDSAGQNAGKKQADA